MQSKDTEISVQSAFQRDSTLNMLKSADLKIVWKDFHVGVSSVLLRSRIEGGRDADKNAIVKEIVIATGAQILGFVSIIIR